MKTNKILEFRDFNLSNQELMEMANITDETSGIQDVVIWIGPKEPSHGDRVKISNIPNNFNGHNCFTITIPDLKIIGEIDNSFITSKKLKKIKEFINKNMNVILQYSHFQISTKTLLDTLQKI
jgi:hypothetical protein